MVLQILSSTTTGGQEYNSLKNKTANTGIFKLIEQLLDNRPVDQVLHHVLYDHQLLLIGTQAHQHQGSSRGLRNPETIIL